MVAKSAAERVGLMAVLLVVNWVYSLAVRLAVLLVAVLVVEWAAE